MANMASKPESIENNDKEILRQMQEALDRLNIYYDQLERNARDTDIPSDKEDTKQDRMRPAVETANERLEGDQQDTDLPAVSMQLDVSHLRTTDNIAKSGAISEKPTFDDVRPLADVSNLPSDVCQFPATEGREKPGGDISQIPTSNGMFCALSEPSCQYEDPAEYTQASSQHSDSEDTLEGTGAEFDQETVSKTAVK